MYCYIYVCVCAIVFVFFSDLTYIYLVNVGFNMWTKKGNSLFQIHMYYQMNSKLTNKFQLFLLQNIQIKNDAASDSVSRAND